MSDALSFDVLIVGAGMAGSALALALRDSGLSVALVEARALDAPSLPSASDLHSFDARVSALTPQSQAFLDRLGVWEDIAAYRSCAYRHMSVWDAEGTGAIDFDAGELSCPALGHIVENRAVLAALLQQIQRCPSISVQAPRCLQSVERKGQVLRLSLDQGPALEAGLLVAADGALSRVRSLMEFDTREWDYGHHAVVASVQVSKPHEDTAWQRFLPGGPLAFLPLPSAGEAHYCSIVWSLPDDRVEALMALDDAGFCEELGRAFEQRLGPVLGASPRSAFPLRQRHAVDYVQAGVALVGDAAHTIHPLAGQGINLGFQDVAALAAELSNAARRGQAPGELAVLRRYQRQRKGENLLMMAAMESLKFVFEQPALPLRWLRNTGLRAVSGAAPVKQAIMRHAMGLRL